MSIRVRFAPSPTGLLHIGGVRTALFNWLFAKNKGGKFLLRIEDTDLERSSQDFTQDIFNSLKWLGLNWDEEVIFQSQRLELYREKAQALVAQGKAYYCNCTEESLEVMRTKALADGKKPQYDRRCRDLNLKTGQVIRAKIPLEGHVIFQDLIRGSIRIENLEVDDFVLVRSNGAPTYNLSCVVDDVASEITHVIRGDDHINNTPKQMHLYRFFDYKVPEFVHLPMILGPDKKKLSKRHGAVSANVYRAEGYLPEALLGFLVRLGWSHGDQEIFSIEEMTRYFSFEKVQKSSGVFNPEKLLWLNGEHLRKMAPERLCQIIAQDFDHHFQPPAEIESLKSPLGVKLAALILPKVKRVRDAAEQMVPLCTPGLIEVDGSQLKWNTDEKIKKELKLAIAHLTELLSQKMSEAKGHKQSLEEVGMGHHEIDALLRQVCESHGVKLGDLAQPLRLCVSGRMVSAGLFDLLSVLPWDRVKPRLQKVQEL